MNSDIHRRLQAQVRKSGHCPGELPLIKGYHSITYFVAQVGWATSNMLMIHYQDAILVFVRVKVHVAHS